MKQLFYDLYNNCLNEKANEHEFNTIYKNNKILAEIYYDICIKYLSLSEKEQRKLDKIVNNMADFIKVEIFKA